MMKHLSGLAAVAVLLLAAGQSMAATVVSATIPFEFTAGASKLPAGQYEVSQDSTSAVLTLRKVDSGESTLTPYVTRLARRVGDPSTVLVFDKVGDQYTLSEIHVTGIDGYYVGGAKGEHTHAPVKATKKG